ncbi:MAG: hypothetical protein FIB07_13265 [Candidatus Methanoperedens sp.]|nr:hypothetical protein [Candidatus Methanoperedens sp.]
MRSNNKDYANMAIERYREKIRAVEDSVSNTTGNVSGLFGAQRKIMKHQFVREVRENNDTEVNSRGEENNTRGDYSRKIPPMGWWE